MANFECGRSEICGPCDRIDGEHIKPLVCSVVALSIEKSRGEGPIAGINVAMRFLGESDVVRFEYAEIAATAAAIISLSRHRDEIVN